MYAAKTAGRDTIRTAEPQRRQTLNPTTRRLDRPRQQHQHDVTENVLAEPPSPT
jgi:hypothetical protein